MGLRQRCGVSFLYSLYGRGLFWKKNIQKPQLLVVSWFAASCCWVANIWFGFQLTLSSCVGKKLFKRIKTSFLFNINSTTFINIFFLLLLKQRIQSLFGMSYICVFKTIDIFTGFSRWNNIYTCICILSVHNIN